MSALPIVEKLRKALDETPTGGLQLPRWKALLRSAVACLEMTDQTLTPEYRKRVSEMLGQHQVALNAALEAADTIEQLYEALGELIELVRPNVYPCPDKPDSPYGKLERARLAHAKARGERA